MRRITFRGGRDEPSYYEIHESYKGEARDEILTMFCFEGCLNDEVLVYDDLSEEEIWLKTSEWLEPFEILQLNLIHDTAPESFFEDLTLEKLKDVLASHRS